MKVLIQSHDRGGERVWQVRLDQHCISFRSEAEARQRIPDSAGKRCDLPYATLRSNGSGHSFRLFIRHGPLLDNPTPGTFGAYGLSTQASVPWF